jgi:hypothetical protein
MDTSLVKVNQLTAVMLALKALKEISNKPSTNPVIETRETVDPMLFSLAVEKHGSITQALEFAILQKPDR